MTTQLDLLPGDWYDGSIIGLTWRLNEGDEFTSDDLHCWLKPPPKNNCWGILTAKLSHIPRYERIGDRPSTRPQANGRRVAVWRVRG